MKLSKKKIKELQNMLDNICIDMKPALTKLLNDQSVNQKL